jgi:hypothetical protein
VLADLLGAYRDRPDVLVLGLARGGIPVAWEVAAALPAPLDAFIAITNNERSQRIWRRQPSRHRAEHRSSR